MAEDNGRATKAELDLMDECYKKALAAFKQMNDASRWSLLTKFRRLSDARVISGNFDHKQAREIRENLKLTRRKLIEKFSGMSTITLYKYETGKLDPLVSQKKSTMAYVEWLKEHGYK